MRVIQKVDAAFFGDFRDEDAVAFDAGDRIVRMAAGFRIGASLTDLAGFAGERQADCPARFQLFYEGARDFLMSCAGGERFRKDGSVAYLGERVTFDNGIATVNTETAEALGLDYSGFAEKCTAVVETVTAEEFE